MNPVAIATWKFGRIAATTAGSSLEKGLPALDAAIAGAQAVEDDPDVRSVGRSSLPDAIGRLTLDACVMEGRTLRCGAVAGVENIGHVAALARRVMEKTPHILLVGEGARWFAIQEGFPLENLQSPEALREWGKRSRKKRNQEMLTHDTVTVLTLDGTGSLGGACTTSGLSHKLPGRVGDSPIIGAGLYVDDEAGAAGGTGVGEEILRIGGGLSIVEAMRRGHSPQQACEQAVDRVCHVAKRAGKKPAEVAFIALNPDGRVGAACTEGTIFHYATYEHGVVKIRKA
ncbi:MAG: isoaspartyl peptidase/L-asparaginase [Gemmataceae bacterium]